MYQVSDRFLSAMNSFIIQPVLRGTVGDVAFTDEDILENSFRCCNQCVTVNDVKVGGVFVGEIQMTLLKSVANTRGDWYGKKIRCEYGLIINGEAEFIPCPSYEYTINEATWTENGLKIVAYDNMLLLDRQYSSEQSSGFPWEWLQYISKKTGIALGNTQSEIEAMTNGTQILGLVSADKVETYRDCLSYLVSVLGGFATIDRQGRLIIRQFNSPVVAEINAESRFTGCSFSDYVTRYTGLSVVDADSQQTIYIHINPDDGLTLNLGNNPFLQYGIPSIREQIRFNILSSIQSFEYVPFKVTTIGCCAYDLGDCIEFTGGIAQNSIGCIMSYDFGMNDYSIGGYGDNPALESAQSKSDKNITGLAKQTSSEQLAVTTLTNIGEVGISSEWTKVGGIAFYVTKEQTLLFHGVSEHNLTNGGMVEYKYVLNDEELDFVHREQFGVGVDTSTLFIPFSVPAERTQRFDVYVRSDDAVGTIESINMRGALIGAGIVGASWDGTINVTDAFNLTLVGRMTIPFAEGGINTSILTPINGGSVSDEYDISLEGLMAIDFADAFSITTVAPESKRITEDGRLRFTEDNNGRMTE